MPPAAHSPEFARLVQHWLDETATPDEAALLWQRVAECPDCAREFAAAARFESLLAETVATPAKALFTVLPGGKEAAAPVGVKLGGSKPAHVRHLLRAAAVLALLGWIAWLLRPAPQDSPQTARKTPAAKQILPQKRTLVGAATAPSTPVPNVDKLPALPHIPLPERLERFFLTSVSFDQVPLSQALGLLQGQLQELNYLKTADLERLRVTVPAEAAGRRISFHSGPIVFLKAVRAIAALGGCEVSVDEPTLALILHREIFPQVPERRDVREILAGRVNADGSAADSDPARISELMKDAASLGLAVTPETTAEMLAALLVTRGQWTALQVLTDAREQLRSYPAPIFQMYVEEVEENPPQEDRVLDAEEVTAQRQANLVRGITPVAVVQASVTPIIPIIMQGAQVPLQPLLTAQPVGEVVQVTATIPASYASIGPAPSGVLLLGTADANGTLSGYASAILRGDQGAVLNFSAANTALIMAGLAVESQMRLTLLPVMPP